MFRFVGSLRWIVGLLAVVIVAGASAGTAAAAAPNRNQRDTARLERAYVAAQSRLKTQDLRLQLAVEHANRVDRVIADLQGQGRDTTALEDAAAAFRTDIATARQLWSAASGTLATHAGFDDQGRVTDVEAARATLRDARTNMRDASLKAREAYLELHLAFNQFRQDNPDVREPRAPARP